MIFGNGNLKARSFHEFYVILPPFEEVYHKNSFVLWVSKCFHLLIFLRNKSTAIVFAIRRDKAKEKGRLFARCVEYQSNWSELVIPLFLDLITKSFASQFFRMTIA